MIALVLCELFALVPRPPYRQSFSLPGLAVVDVGYRRSLSPNIHSQLGAWIEFTPNYDYTSYSVRLNAAFSRSDFE